MKNFVKIGLIAAALFAAPGAFANDVDFSLKVKNEKEKTIRIFINQPKEVELFIYSTDDEVLLEDKIHASKELTKTYDLNALPDGKYMVKVEMGAQVAIYEVTIANDMASLSAPTIKEVLRPEIKVQEDFITLNLENAAKGPIEVQVLDENNDQVFLETFKDKSSLFRKFNISQSNCSAFTFVIKQDKQVFTKTIQTL
ncbi:hypothetical protein [Pedobacter rhizosphaerae]|uniref:Por secretion system C-terminal sorting domain-containing protein n=1 Tax=Pedobacter rhizosphaerae TaxID=390241 RepID=A0A1H9QEL2_9SPHI|nr:hypothetical protein [Pedobacter rhizosphaerae]SER58319.1 hypothetical protein SAMN04488023_111146 [Pedobacter rhizosphaerae]